MVRHGGARSWDHTFRSSVKWIFKFLVKWWNSSTMVPPIKSYMNPQNVPPIRDQLFRYVNLWDISHLDATTFYSLAPCIPGYIIMKNAFILTPNVPRVFPNLNSLQVQSLLRLAQPFQHCCVYKNWLGSYMFVLGWAKLLWKAPFLIEVRRNIITWNIKHN